jgi:hypothetical protein
MIAEFLQKTGQHLVRARVESVGPSGEILVSDPDGTMERQPCDILQTAEQSSLHLKSNDTVLVWIPTVEEDSRPVIIGRVAAPSDPLKNETPCAGDLLLEAKESLTLKCGDGSITIRADGKVLIKGKDLVSSAIRMNRIKGGAVSIN